MTNICLFLFFQGLREGSIRARRPGRDLRNLYPPVFQETAHRPAGPRGSDGQIRLSGLRPTAARHDLVPQRRPDPQRRPPQGRGQRGRRPLAAVPVRDATRRGELQLRRSQQGWRRLVHRQPQRLG